jgi:hypothetical protein
MLPSPLGAGAHRDDVRCGAHDPLAEEEPRGQLRILGEAGWRPHGHAQRAPAHANLERLLDRKPIDRWLRRFVAPAAEDRMFAGGSHAGRNSMSESEWAWHARRA